MGVKKTLVALTFAAVASAALVNLNLTGAKAISIGGPSDSSSNSVIPGGVHSTEALIDDYDSSACVRDVFSHFGISSAMVHNLPSTNVAGFVTKSNEVFVNGSSSPVATGAVTGGFSNIAGSTQFNLCGKQFFQRPPSVSFDEPSLPAFVSIVNGQFSFAVLAACGNVVVATPVHHMTPTPVTPTKPVVHKTVVNKVTVKVTNRNTVVQVQSQQQSQHQSVVVNQTPASPTQTSAQVQTSSATTPSTLPNTGPGSLLGVFGLTSLAGLVGHRFYLIRKASRL